MTTPTERAIAQLQTLRAIGPIGAWVLATEIFGWRQIRNGRQLGALVGLVPAPYKSGETEHDQGITRAGNAHVRRVIVQLAWGWLHHQPTSALVVVVSTPFWQRRETHPKDRDCRARAQAPDRVVALSGDRAAS